MKLTVLGSGTCVPSLKRSSPAVFLKISDKNILVDIGVGTMHRMLRASIDYKEIDFIFLTHFHPDHVGELRSFIQALDWTPGFDRKKDLVLVGPVGLKSFYDRTINSEPRPNTYKIKFIEIENHIILSDFKVEYVKTIHSEESIAYKFIQKGKSVVITGDCDYDKNLVNFVKSTDLLLIDCSFSNELKVKGHLTPKECGNIAKKANVKKMFLTHLYPVNPDFRLEQAREIFENTELAEDLLTMGI